MPQENIFIKTSTKADGNMSFRFGETNEVVENRRTFLEKNDICFEDHICMACNQGDTITAVNRSNRGIGAVTQDEMLKSEVLVTQEKNLALMLLTADCIPATLYDPVQKVIALAHLNRKTITYDLAQKTVGFLRDEFNSNPTDLHVNFGPHIKKRSYRFTLPLTEETPPQLQDFVEEKSGFVHIDIVSAFLHQLKEAGVQNEQVSISDIDTATSENYFSHYRRQQDPAYPNGRLATIAMIYR